MKESTSPSLSELAAIRHLIDDIDATLLTAYAERARLVRQAARLKLAAGSEPFDYRRETEILSGARALGVHAEAFMNHVLALTRLDIYDEIARHQATEPKG